MNTIEKIFIGQDEERNTPLYQEYAEYLTQQGTEEIKQLSEVTEMSKYVNDLTLDNLLKLPFDVSHKYIKLFTLEKRIEILDKLTTYRAHLYEQTNRYGAEGLRKDEQLGPKDFRMLLGKIKHLEILQAWLFGIE